MAKRRTKARTKARRIRGIRVDWTTSRRGGGQSIRTVLTREARDRLIEKLAASRHRLTKLFLHGNADGRGYFYVERAARGVRR